MINKIKNWLIYSKMEKTIKLAITAIYSENFDFDEIRIRICHGSVEHQLLGYIAIRKATSVVEPLKISDIDVCVQEYYLSLSRKSAQNIFSEIMALQQNLWVNFGSGSFPSVWNRVICSNSKLR